MLKLECRHMSLHQHAPIPLLGWADYITLGFPFALCITLGETNAYRGIQCGRRLFNRRASSSPIMTSEFVASSRSSIMTSVDSYAWEQGLLFTTVGDPGSSSIIVPDLINKCSWAQTRWEKFRSWHFSCDFQRISHSHRSITLSSFILKTIERLIEWYNGLSLIDLCIVHNTLTGLADPQKPHYKVWIADWRVQWIENTRYHHLWMWNVPLDAIVPALQRKQIR